MDDLNSRGYPQKKCRYSDMGWGWARTLRIATAMDHFVQPNTKSPVVSR
jgi:hypothetical protein